MSKWVISVSPCLLRLVATARSMFTFDIVQWFTNLSCRTICGTLNYIALEVLFETANGHSLEVDTWSIGVILSVLFLGIDPVLACTKVVS